MNAAGHSEQDRKVLESLLEESKQIRGVSLWQDAGKRLRRDKAAMFAIYTLIALALLALLTPLLPLQSPIDKDLDDRLFLPPNTQRFVMGARKGLKFKDGSLSAQLAAFEEEIDELRTRQQGEPDARKRDELSEQIANRIEVEHPFNQLWNNIGPLSWAMCKARVAVFGDYAVPSIFGTDKLGRDVLSRVFWGARISLIVGIVATFVSLIIGVSYGATAGFFGGATDKVMMRIVDIMYSVPFLFVVILLMTFLGNDQVKLVMNAWGIDQITVFFFVIGAIYWLTMARVVRGQVLSLKEEQFVESARTVGASPPRIIYRHLVPNVLGIVIVYLTLTIPAVMLFEAFLSFLGLGVSPPDVSWGLLLKDGVDALSSVKLYWWVVVFPGAALAATLFALNFLGDGLRDALDPKMKNRD